RRAGEILRLVELDRSQAVSGFWSSGRAPSRGKNPAQDRIAVNALTPPHPARAAIARSCFHLDRREKAKRSPTAYIPRSHLAAHSGWAASPARTNPLRFRAGAALRVTHSHRTA